jgi:hypothetical protein
LRGRDQEYPDPVSTTQHVLAFCALGINLLLGGILIEESFGAGWRNIFEIVLIGLYLVIAWDIPRSLRPSSRDDGSDDPGGGRR